MTMKHMPDPKGEATPDVSEMADENKICERITATFQSVRWKVLEVTIRQLPEENDLVDMMGAVMGLIGAAMWIEKNIKNKTSNKPEETNRKVLFLQLVASLWDDERG